MFSTPNSKLLSSMENLGVNIHQIRKFKREIALKPRSGDPQDTLETPKLRFTAIPPLFSVVCFTIEDVGVLLFGICCFNSVS
jgi:hypothetical protein